MSGTKIAYERISYLQNSFSKDQHLLSADKCSAETGKLIVRTVRHQLLTKPQSTQSTVENIAEIFIVKVLGRASSVLYVSSLANLLSNCMGRVLKH